MTEHGEMPPDPDEMSTESALRVRPYTMTRGRTRAEVDLGIETIIRSAGNGADDPALTSEARALIRLCAHPLSIAEISAHLKLPLQVVKIVAGDLVMAGRVETHTGSLRSDGRPDLALLERVLDGLQAL